MQHKQNRKKKTRPPVENVRSLPLVFSDFCQNTSGHGFQYWVSAGSQLERLLWVAIVAFGFSAASIMVHSAVAHWINNKGKLEQRWQQMWYPVVPQFKRHYLKLFHY